jgi:hypothetical protein
MQSSQPMTLGRFLEHTRRDATEFEEIARNQAIKLWHQDGYLMMHLLQDRLSPTAKQRAFRETPQQGKELMSIWFRGEICAKGPKVFRPTLEQCLAMEQIAPRIPIADYAQPYPVMIVEFPEAFTRQRASAADNQLYVGSHTPEFVLVGSPPCDVATLWLLVCFSSSTSRTFSSLASDATIEDGIVRVYGEESYFPLDAPTPDERLVMAGLLRLGVNAMLLLMECGCRRLGPANESHYRRLQHHLDLARKRAQRVAEAERQLRLATQLYGLDQHIVLHEEESSGASVSAGGVPNVHRRPHWRRGHWKMHACGPGRSLRKRILIKPVMVNKDLLASETTFTPTTYRVK